MNFSPIINLPGRTRQVKRHIKWRSAARWLGLLCPFLLSSPAFSTETAAFTESVIIFNTLCAKCHEAQCSGRLSFEEAFEKSTNHILRYYDQASGKQWLQKELFDILNYMKTKCAYYPMQAAVPLKRIWAAEFLEEFSTLMEKNYFIPVGRFTPGNYLIALEFEKDVKVTVNLISEEFDMVTEECLQSKERRIHIPVLIEEPGDYYFRIYPGEAVKLIRLAIMPQ